MTYEILIILLEYVNYGLYREYHLEYYQEFVLKHLMFY